MKWIAIAGTWRQTNNQVEEDVREIVRGIITRGDGIISGGALGVDYIATDEALNQNISAERIKIYLPSALEVYAVHYLKRAKEGVITKEQAEGLIAQLKEIKNINSDSIIENKDNSLIDQETYFARISLIIEAADELIAFQVNQSAGTQDTIDKAKAKGIPVKVFSYTV